MKPATTVVTSVGMSPILFRYIADCYPYGYKGFISTINKNSGKPLEALPVIIKSRPYLILLDTEEIRNFLDTCVRNNLTNELQPWEESCILVEN